MSQPKKIGDLSKSLKDAAVTILGRTCHDSLKIWDKTIKEFEQRMAKIIVEWEDERTFVNYVKKTYKKLYQYETKQRKVLTSNKKCKKLGS